jgi:hypothetical protein
MALALPIARAFETRTLPGPLLARPLIAPAPGLGVAARLLLAIKALARALLVEAIALAARVAEIIALATVAAIGELPAWRTFVAPAERSILAAVPIPLAALALLAKAWAGEFPLAGLGCAAGLAAARPLTPAAAGIVVFIFVAGHERLSLLGQSARRARWRACSQTGIHCR